MADLIDIKFLDLNELELTNLKDKNYKFKNNCLDWILNNNRVLFSDYSLNKFNQSLGLMSNLSRDGSKFKGDLTFYDVNGYDTGMPNFVIDGYNGGSFFIRPLIKIVKIEEGVVTKADIICFGVVFRQV